MKKQLFCLITMVVCVFLVNAGATQFSSSTENGKRKVVKDTVRTDSLPLRTMLQSSSVEVPDYKEKTLTPEMFLMNMYGDYPVELSTGLVGISIPLYEIKSAQLSLPVSLKFHASGLKADEQEGRIGVRWVLDANYSVSRTIKGYPDDEDYDIQHRFVFDSRVNNPEYEPDLATLYGTTYKPGATTDYAISSRLEGRLSNFSGKSSPYMDTEYDIFNYQLPSGKSGKFILRDSADVKIPCTIPYEPIKIELKKSHNAAGQYHQVTITDENGITYNYGRALHQTSYGVALTYSGANLTPTGWLLNEMISADKKDSILFDYKYIYIGPRQFRASTIYTIKDEYVTQYRFPTNDEAFSNYLIKQFSYVPKTDCVEQFEDGSNYYTLSSITFKGGRVTFDYNTVFNQSHLTFMKVLDKSSSTVKNISFSYKQDGTLVLLDKLSFLDSKSQQGSGTYKFDYHNNYYTANQETQADWWGYFSSGRQNIVYDNNVRSIPANISSSIGLQPVSLAIGSPYSQNKNASLSSMKTGMIKSIEYPAGGKTLYEYDSNYYINRNGQKEACGGLRIKSVENISADGKSEVKSYDYNPEDNGCGFMPSYLYPPQEKNFLTETTIVAVDGPFQGGEFRQRDFSNIVPGQFHDFHTNIVYYDKVIEYQGTGYSHAGYTEYSYSYKMPVETQYFHQPTWSDTYRYTNNNNSRQFTYVLPPQFGESSQLEKKSVFMQNGQLLEETTFEYMPFTKGSLYDLPVKRYRKYDIMGEPSFVAYADDKEVEYADSEMLAVFGYIHQEYQLGASRLTKETVRRNTPAGQTVTVKDIEYDPQHLMPVKETVSTSLNNEKVSVTYKYPYQYNQAPYTGMTQRNILSPVIEKSVYKNGNFLEKGITNYYNWNPDMYAPISFQYQKQGQNLETRLEYQYNTQGQLKETVKDGEQRIVYIRNACGQSLAVIEQASYSDVQYILGATFIEALSKKPVASDSDMSQLHRLHTGLLKAMVTIYKYRPLVGISEITDPAGLVTYYDYDGMGWLKEVYRLNGASREVIESYQYNFKNQ